MDPQKVAEKVQELREGNLPSNPEIISTLETVKQTQANLPAELSPTGQQVSQGIAQVVEDVQKIIEEKNTSESMQDMVKELFQAAQVAAPGSEETQEMGMNLVKVANMFITSASFRKALADFIAIGKQHCSFVSEFITAQGSGSTLVAPDPYDNIGHSAFEKRHQQQAVQQASPSIELSQEERNKLGEDFYNLMNELQEREEYQQAVGYLCTQASSMHEAFKENLEANLPEEFLRAGKAGKKMLEDWFDVNLEQMTNRLYNLNKRISDNDEILSQWEQLGHFVKNCLTEQGYLSDGKWIKEEAKERFYSLHEAVQKDDKQVHLVRELLDDWEYLLERANRDDTLQKLGHDLTTLYSHLLKDAEGRPAFKPELIKDLRLVLPIVLRRLQYIKVPDMLVDDLEGGYALTVQNALVNVSELAPRQISLSFDLGEDENRLAFRLKGINADVKGLMYSLDKRSGFPKWQDSGLADIRIHGTGMDLLIVLAPTNYQDSEKETPRYGIAIHDVKCIIHHLDLNLYETQHDWVYSVFGPWVRSALRLRLERMIEEQLKGMDLSVSAETVESLKENVLPSQ